MTCFLYRMRTQPPPCWRDRVACYLHREWERLRKLARFPLFSGFQRFDRARLVEMEHRVELIRQSRVEIMALPLGFGTVDHTDRPLEPRHGQLLHHRVAVIQDEQEAVTPRGVEQRLVAARERRPNPFTFGRFAPIGGGCDRALVGGKADQHRFAAVFLTRKLADIELAALARLGPAGAAGWGF